MSGSEPAASHTVSTAEWQAKLLSLCRKGSLETIKSHFEFAKQSLINCDPNFQDEETQTPLMLAAAFGSLPLVTYLVQEAGADINCFDAEGFGALTVACLGGCTPLVRFFMSHPQFIRPPTSHTPLIAAATHCLDTVKCLVEEFKQDLNEKGPKGYTPLMIAARTGNLDVVRYLIRSGADPTIANEDGHTVYDIEPLCDMDSPETAQRVFTWDVPLPTRTANFGSRAPSNSLSRHFSSSLWPPDYPTTGGVFPPPALILNRNSSESALSTYSVDHDFSARFRAVGITPMHKPRQSNISCITISTVSSERSKPDVVGDMRPIAASPSMEPNQEASKRDLSEEDFARHLKESGTESELPRPEVVNFAITAPIALQSLSQTRSSAPNLLPTSPSHPSPAAGRVLRALLPPSHALSGIESGNESDCSPLNALDLPVSSNNTLKPPRLKRGPTREDIAEVILHEKAQSLKLS